MLNEFTKQWQTLSRWRWAIAVALVALAGAGFYGFAQIGGTKAGHSEVSSQSRKGLQRYTPSAAEWASLTIQPVTERGFRAEHVTEGKTVPLKDYKQSQATLIQAQNDLRASQTAMEAARNKLRILGLTDEDIATFQEKGRINPEITIFAPLAGTVVQRKIGPGQYVNAGASDPVYVIGDLSTVWMTAFVRESDSASVAIGQEVTITALDLPGRPL